jgi:catechol 2,3-dioxygenase-like lactoylglutathione lyase family enzyme
MMIELQQILSPAPHFATTRDTVRPRIVSVAFLVTSIDDVLEDLSKSGVAAVGTPSRVDLPRHGSSRIAFVRDPDGNLIELVEPIRGADAPPP